MLSFPCEALSYISVPAKPCCLPWTLYAGQKSASSESSVSFIELAWAPEPSVTRGDAGGPGGEQGRNVFFALEQAAGEDGTF